MSDAITLALIDKIPVMVAALASTFSGYFAYRTHAVAKNTEAVARQTASVASHTAEVATQTEANTNGLKDQLVTEVRAAAFAAGQKHETDKEQK